MISLSPQIRSEMQRLTQGLPTKSAKIRRLAEKGYEKADIARFLEIRYQHVRNVLNQPLVGSGTAAYAVAQTGEQPGMQDEAAAFAQGGATDSLRVFRFQVDVDGRIKLPGDALKALDASPGGLITARFEDGELRLMNIEASVRFAQALAAPYIKKGEGNWSDQLIAERRAEASRENDEVQ